MPSTSVENYLKAIYQLQRRGEGRVKTKALADHLGLSLPSVTSMMKALADASLVDYRPYQGVELTASGEEAALRVLRNHRLVELFLVKTLGFSWDEVHVEAERLEHAVSEKLADRIDAFLGHPRFDPHGDPIPTRDGRVESLSGTPLSQLGTDREATVVRVLDQDPALLRFLDAHGLRPGVQVILRAADPFGGSLHVELSHGRVAIGRAVGDRLLVRCAEDSAQSVASDDGVAP